MLSQYILVINTKNNQVCARPTDDRWHVMIVVGTLNVGCISLTIQGKCDLKALSSEKIMINKCIDYSHVIREQVRKISCGLETIDD